MNIHSGNSIIAVSLVVLCLSPTGLPVTAASSDIIYSACNVRKYSNGSEYESNVDAFLRSVEDNATSMGFLGGSYGQSPSRVFGRFQCRGDLPAGDCRVCSAGAAKSIREQCPNAVGARIQLEYCFLRYENYTFLSKLDTSFWYGLVNVDNDTDPHFNLAVRSLMLNLSTEAPATDNFAAGSTADLSSPTIYGLEMCWRDMSARDCATCLSQGLAKMYSC